MEIKYVDAHCHMQFADYAADGDALVARMKDEGVAGIVVGVDLDSSRAALALAEKHEHVFAAVGLHPNRVDDETFDADAFRELAAHPRVVGIGECGLDFFRPTDVTDAVKEKQKELLQKHIELAAAADKPLIIHCRPSKGTMDAYEDLIGILTEAKAASGAAVRGDIHFFVGGVSEAEALSALGFTVSFTAVITFARDYDAVIRSVPLTNILAETDAPYVAPASRRGTRNDPLAVVEVVRRIAEVRGEDEEAVRTALAANAVRLFSMPIAPR